MGTTSYSSFHPNILIDPTENAELISQNQHYKVYRNSISGVEYEKYEIGKSNPKRQRILDTNCSTMNHNYLYGQNMPSSQPSHSVVINTHPKPLQQTLTSFNTSTFQSQYQYRLAHRSRYFVQLFYAGPKANQLSCKLMSVNHDSYCYLVVTQRIVYRLSEMYNLSFENSIRIINSGLKGFMNLIAYNELFWIKDSMIGVNQLGEIKVWLNSNFGKNNIQELPPCLERLTIQEKEDLVVNNFIDIVGSKTRQCAGWWEFMKMRMEYLMGVVRDSDQLIQRRGGSSSANNITAFKYHNCRKMTFTKAIEMVQRIMRRQGLGDMIDDNKINALFDERISKYSQDNTNRNVNQDSQMVELNNKNVVGERMDNDGNRDRMVGTINQIKQIRQTITADQHNATTKTVNIKYNHSKSNQHRHLQQQQHVSIINHNPTNTIYQVPIARNFLVNNNNNHSYQSPTPSSNTNSFLFNPSNRINTPHHQLPAIHAYPPIHKNYASNIHIGYSNIGSSVKVLTSQSRSISNTNNDSKSPRVRFSHSMDKPIIVKQIRNNRQQAIKVNFVNNTLVQHKQTHYPRQSTIISKSKTQSITPNQHSLYNKREQSRVKPLCLDIKNEKKERMSDGIDWGMQSMGMNQIFENSPVKYTKIQKKQVQKTNDNSIKITPVISNDDKIIDNNKLSTNVHSQLSPSNEKERLLVKGSMQILQELKIDDDVEDDIRNQQVKEQQLQQKHLKEEEGNNNTEYQRVITSERQQQQIVVGEELGCNASQGMIAQGRNNNKNNDQQTNQDHSQNQPVIRIAIDSCSSLSQSNSGNNPNEQLPSSQQQQHQSPVIDDSQSRQQSQSHIKGQLQSSKPHFDLFNKYQQRDNIKSCESSYGEGYKFNLRQVKNVFQQLPLQVSYNSLEISNRMITIKQSQVIERNQLQSQILRQLIDKLQKQSNNNNNQLKQISNKKENHSYIHSGQLVKQRQQQQEQSQQMMIFQSKYKPDGSKLSKWENRFQQQPYQQKESNGFLMSFKNHFSRMKQQPREDLELDRTFRDSAGEQSTGKRIGKDGDAHKQQIRTVLKQPTNINVLLTQQTCPISHPSKATNIITYKHLRTLLKSSNTNYSTSPESIY